MIYGNISELTQILFLNKNSKELREVFNFLQKGSFNDLTVGRFELGIQNVYGIYQTYSTHEKEGGVWEAHKKYLDIQYLIEGKELLSYASVDMLDITKEYSESDDVMLGVIHTGDKEIKLESGDFVVLFPEEAHMPAIIENNVSVNRKIVFKLSI